MSAFRVLLALMFGAVAIYTGVVGARHGWDLLPVFFGDMAAFTWPGQFNLDFACLLVLAGLWVAWRNRFSPAGCALGVLAAVGGVLVLAPYVFFASIRAGGDPAVLLLGRARAG